MLTIDFTKYQALGNDFVVIDQLKELRELTSEQARRLCDRHLGIGADGIVVVRPSANADFRMLFYNGDGSTAEMCGNGIRCLGKFVADRGLVGGLTMTVETGAGVKELTLRAEGGTIIGARVDMGVPSFATTDIPVKASSSEFIDRPLELGRRQLRATCLSMGNPHCVIFVDNVNEAPVATLGPVIERLPIFPKRTNVEFVQTVAVNRMRVRVWERGAGETLACGTGACASLVAAVRNGRAAREAQVEVTGGILDIGWEENDHVYLAGPATEVFTGTIEL